MKSTFIVMAASALIAVSLYAKEVDVTGSSPSAPASPADNALQVMPWIGLGAGWRGIWIDRDVGGTDGVDYRLNSQFPFLLTPASPHDVSLAGACRPRRFSRVNSPDANVWLSAGIQGRFDLFGAVARRCGWLARIDRKQCLEGQRCRRQDWSENIVVGQQDAFQRAAIFRRRGRIRLVRPVVAAIDSLGAERG